MVTITNGDGTTEEVPLDQLAPDGPCEWFALCDRPATSFLDHPVLQLVPVCDRCREKVERLR